MSHWVLDIIDLEITKLTKLILDREHLLRKFEEGLETPEGMISVSGAWYTARRQLEIRNAHYFIDDRERLMEERKKFLRGRRRLIRTNSRFTRVLPEKIEVYISDPEYCTFLRKDLPSDCWINKSSLRWSITEVPRLMNIIRMYGGVDVRAAWALSGVRAYGRVRLSGRNYWEYDKMIAIELWRSKEGEATHLYPRSVCEGDGRFYAHYVWEDDKDTLSPRQYTYMPEDM